MAYTTINKSTDYFNTKLYTGNGGTNAITGVGFQPDFVWLKSRSEASTDHKLLDAVRGVPNFISSNLTAAEASTGSFNSIDSDGFTVDTTNAAYNQSSATYASWNWKANGTGSANTDGSVNSTVSVNTTAGFSIVSYTGNSTAGATVGHGLGVAPAMMIIKNRTSNSNTWTVYHHKLSNPATKFLGLNTTSAEDTSTTNFNSTAPSSSVITLGTDAGTNGSTSMIAYCFAEKKGYSKFGSYTGNGVVDGTFVYTGFKPAFVMVKKTSSTGGWSMFDNKRFGYNPKNHRVFANLSDAEENDDKLDFLSNGFKWRVSQSTQNASGETYIYMAFGQSIVGSNNIPATAR